MTLKFVKVSHPPKALCLTKCDRILQMKKVHGFWERKDNNMKCTWLSGRLWISRSTSNSRSLFASITRKRFKFRSKLQTLWQYLFWRWTFAAGRLLFFSVRHLSERTKRDNHKKSREEGFWRYAVRKDFWDGRRSIFHKGQNKYNQRRPYLPVLSGKNQAFSGFWDTLWVFSLGYPRWWKKTVPSFQAWMSSLQSSWKTKWRPTVLSVSCKLVLILERLRGEIDLKIAGKMILIVKELFNSTKPTNCWLISWISGLVWKADGASATRFVEGRSIFEVFYVDHDAD